MLQRGFSDIQQKKFYNIPVKRCDKATKRCDEATKRCDIGSSIQQKVIYAWKPDSGGFGRAAAMDRRHQHHQHIRSGVLLVLPGSGILDAT